MISLQIGGDIGVISQQGVGAQFYFELNCIEMSSDTHEKFIAKLQKGNRCLLVESNEEIAQIIAIMLRSENYRVDIVSGGRVAERQLGAQAYQLIIIDIHLDDMSGLQLIKQIRTDAATKHLPIIALVAYSSDIKENTKLDPLFAGIAWLPKPPHLSQLITAIDSSLARDQ